MFFTLPTWLDSTSRHSLDDLTRVSRYPWNRITDAIKLLQGHWHLCRLDYVQSRHTSPLEKDRVNLIPTSGSPLSWVRIQKQSNKTLPFWGENSPVPISYRMPRITCEPQLPIPQNVEHVKTSNTKHFQIPWSTMCNKQDPIWVHNLSCWVFIHSTANDDKDPSSFKQPQFSDSDQSKSILSKVLKSWAKYTQSPKIVSQGGRVGKKKSKDE